MTRPSFLLTGKTPLTIYRFDKGEYVNGRYVKGSVTTEEVLVNIQPAMFNEIKNFPESEHSKKWINVWSSSKLRTQKEGFWGSDYFVYDSDWYEVRKEQTYSMGVLDHSYVMAARSELTPDGLPDPLETNL